MASSRPTCAPAGRVKWYAIALDLLLLAMPMVADLHLVDPEAARALRVGTAAVRLVRLTCGWWAGPPQ